LAGDLNKALGGVQHVLESAVSHPAPSSIARLPKRPIADSEHHAGKPPALSIRHCHSGGSYSWNTAPVGMRDSFLVIASKLQREIRRALSSTRGYRTVHGLERDRILFRYHVDARIAVEWTYIRLDAIMTARDV
jgi:hypothetical protein